LIELFGDFDGECAIYEHQYMERTVTSAALNEMKFALGTTNLLKKSGYDVFT